jgi:hypothetical protein
MLGHMHQQNLVLVGQRSRCPADLGQLGLSTQAGGDGQQSLRRFRVPRLSVPQEEVVVEQEQGLRRLLVSQCR